MTRIMTRRIGSGWALAGMLGVGLGAALVSGCGKYGPPEPYPPGYEAPKQHHGGDQDAQGDQDEGGDEQEQQP